METLRSMEKIVSVRCPDCLNYMKAKQTVNGSYSGRCSVCKAAVFSKKRSGRERYIRIVRNTSN